MTRRSEVPKLPLDYSRGNDIPAAKMDQAAAFAGVLAPLKVPKMPLAEPPPRDSRFGSPLRLSKVHWVRPEVVVEVTYLTWTEDNLLRQVSYKAGGQASEAGRAGCSASAAAGMRAALLLPLFA